MSKYWLEARPSDSDGVAIITDVETQTLFGIERASQESPSQCSRLGLSRAGQRRPSEIWRVTCEQGWHTATSSNCEVHCEARGPTLAQGQQPEFVQASGLVHHPHLPDANYNAGNLR